MRDENNLYWVWLSCRLGVESKEFGRLIGSISDPYEIYRMTEEEIEQLRLREDTKKRLCDKSLTDAYGIIKYCKTERVEIIGYGSKKYPERLKSIEDPPILLYCKGKMPDFNSMLCIGIVGTRKMSEYGMRSAYKISYELAAAGTCVVSGMAVGIDGVSACGAIEGGGATVAVLGCGIGRVYPKAHTALAKAIRSSGAIITEFPPDEEPRGYNFPKRNRIISGLCQGIIVIEGAKGSGALITATRAIEQGRQLFALPGKVNESNSDGPNELIKNGAYVALSAEDVIGYYDFLYHDTFDMRAYARAKKSSDFNCRAVEKYGVGTVSNTVGYEKTEVEPSETRVNKAPPKPVVKEKAEAPKNTDTLDASTRKVYDALPDGAFTADALASCGIPVYELMTALTMLEINGLIASLPGGAYKKI